MAAAILWMQAAGLPAADKVATAVPAVSGANLEWRFDEGPRGWTSAQTTELASTSGALAFRATGHDPILFSPDFSHPTSALDVLEIEMASSVSGTAELFWRHDREGAFAGFSARLSRSFEVRPGGFRTVRLRPFWQGHGPVIGIRIDPPGGDGAFEIRAVRILPGPGGPAVKADFDFEAAGAAASAPPPPAQPGAASGTVDATLGWRLDPPGAIRVDADGLHAAPVDGARLVSPVLDLDAGSLRHIAVDVTAPGNPGGGGVLEATVEFAAADRGGSFRRPFRLRAGARSIVVISMEESPAWTGSIAALLIGLSPPARGELVIRSLHARAEAVAPPGTPAGSGGRGPGRSLEDPATGLEYQTRQLSLLERLPVAPRRIDVAAEAPPETRPVESDYTVAMWYFAAWEPEYEWDGWKPLAERAPWRMPLLHDASDGAVMFGGIRYHRSSDPLVIDWHVHWMREHAVNLILWDWYPRTKETGELDPGFFGNRALETGFLGKESLGGPAVRTNRFEGKISFAVMWTNHPPFDRVSGDLADYVAEHFFLQPNYHRIDGKPLLVLWWPRGLIEATGSEEAARDRIESVRQAARRRGLAGAWVAGIVAPSDAPLVRAIGLDGAMGYNYCGSGGWTPESRVHEGKTIEDRVEDFASQTVPGPARIWREMADALGEDYLLATMPMQDWEPTLRPVSHVVRGSTPDRYRELLLRARTFIEERGLRRFISIEAWNEWLEGSYVEPSTQWGLGWLEAIRDVLGRPHPR